MSSLDVTKTLTQWAKRPLTVKVDYQPQSGKWTVTAATLVASPYSLHASAVDGTLDEAVRQVARLIGGCDPA